MAPAIRPLVCKDCDQDRENRLLGLSLNVTAVLAFIGPSDQPAKCCGAGVDYLLSIIDHNKSRKLSIAREVVAPGMPADRLR